MQYKFNSTNNVLLLGTLLVLGLAVIIWGAATKWKFIKSGNDAQKPTPGSAQLGDKCSQLLGAPVNETCASGLVCRSSNTDKGGVPVCMKPDNTPTLGHSGIPPVSSHNNTDNNKSQVTLQFKKPNGDVIDVPVNPTMDESYTSMSNIEEGGGDFKNAMHSEGWDLALLKDGKPYNNGWMTVTPSKLMQLKKKIQNDIPDVDFGKSTALLNFMNGKGSSSACVQIYTNKDWSSTPVINWFDGDCSNRNGAQHLDYPKNVNINGAVKNFPQSLINTWQNATQWTPGTYTESYTIIPAALYQEGITNTSPSSCFTGADTGPPYTQYPNGSCQKNTAGSYGNSFGYDIYQNTVTYDPNSNLNYGYTDGAVESYAMVQHPISGYLIQTQQNNHRGHQTAASEQWKHKNTYMIEF